MKICLVNNLCRPYERGGSERVVDFVHTGLKGQGHEVFLISGAPYRRIKTDERLGTYYLRSIFYNIHRVPIFFRFFWHIWNAFDIVTILKIWFILKKEAPDIVMTHNLKGISFLLPRFLKLWGIKHIHTIHDVQLLYPSGLMMHNEENKLESFPAKVYQAISRFLFAAPSVVISPSRWLMEMHIANNFFEGSEKFVLPNPSPKFPQVKIDFKKEDNKFIFLFVGQIEDHKGAPFLVKTFVNFWEPFWTSSAGEKEKLSIELWLVGPGSKLSEVGKLAYGDKRIKILGGKAHSEIKELMQEADCLIVPSLCYENSPTVIYEAVFLGLPVIASRLGGTVELIHRSGGILFNPGDPENLIEKMKYVLEHRETLRSIRIKENKFKPSNYIEDLTKLIC